ncbi:AraC family transcriptional regulator [Leeia oryzae]|uniref:AraC family transcriptional regulator n=1 Tax=Leeia oryzae TaxID=356662 RepID=UPI00037FFA64|nr:AraC family transcriptional regulator [Leeia oryzae]
MSLQEYSYRMNKVLDHIDQHLEASLELPDLAAVAHFSAFHFHRMFAAWMGETVGDYIRRRRLEVAARRLRLQPRTSVLEVAVSVGFSSGEAFARAFKSHFQCTPSGWRRGGAGQWAAALPSPFHALQLAMRNPDQLQRNPHQFAVLPMPHTASVIMNKECVMDVKLVTLPPTRVATLRKIGPYGQAINDFWRETFVPWLQAHDLLDSPKYGIGYDDPSVTPAEKCRYDAAVVIADDMAVSAPATVQILPGGRYAVRRFEGKIPDIFIAWKEIMGIWLPQSGLTLDDRPCFEYFDASSRHDPETGIFSCDICIPVRPL